MYKILLVSAFGRVETLNNDRVNSLHDYLTSDVKIVTTDFSHRYKKYHEKKTFRNVDFLHVSKYKHNLSFARMLSHWSFTFGLFKYLMKDGRKYDCIYCLIPTPSSALACSFYRLFHKKILFVIDVIDIWPDSLLPLNKNLRFLKPFLFPWKLISIIAYNSADCIFAATKEYMRYASRYNDKAFKSFYPLGVDLSVLNSIIANSKIKISKPDNEIWICYAGSLGSSYDFDAMIESVAFIVNEILHVKIRFLFIGGGYREQELQTKLDFLRLNYLITGYVEYEDYIKYLSFCDIGFNIYLNETKVIQSYKFNDYVVSGIYVINNLQGETADLINKYGVGVNIDNSSINLNNTLKKTILEWTKIKQALKFNSQKLVKCEIDKKMIYEKLEKDIYKMIDNRI